MHSRLIDHRPPARLRAGVLRCTGYEESTDGVISRREVAHDSVTVIFNLGPSMRIGGRGEPMRDRNSFIAAMNGSYGITETASYARGIQVDLDPAFAHRLIGVPMHELSSVVVPLEDVLGRWANEMVERLADDESWERRFELLDCGLHALAAEGAESSPDVGFAWSVLQRSGGRVTVEGLAKELGCSRRHLSNRFREQLGLPPKQAARLIRFNRTVERLSTHQGRRFAEIAAAGGYFDQPHMNREFLEFAGTTPGRFVASALPDAPGFGIEP